MNSALLKSPSDSNDAVITNGMFGKFKGFTLRPLNDTSTPGTNLVGPNVAFVHPVSKTVHDNTMNGGVPQRLAPPPPVHKTPLTELAITKHNGTLGRKAPTPPISAHAAPALPPPNPGSQARPIISMPVLDSSTCLHANSKDLTLPLKPMSGEISPTRTAPSVPPSTDSGFGTLKHAPSPPVPLHADPKLNIKRDGTIRRIASFLKKEEKHPVKEKTYIDREKLKNIEISAPIPVVDTSNSDSEQLEETKNLVKRAQSMRSPTKKTNIQTFGSMRSPPGNARPKSIVSSTRPKSPPPRPPPLKKTNSTTSSGYQMPVATAKSTAENNYDDCEFVEHELSSVGEGNESPAAAGDNIYSVIEEIPPAAQTLKRSDLVSVCSVGSTNGNSGDLGLLSEIVNEIEKRNGDSIYNASTFSQNSKITAKEELPKPTPVAALAETETTSKPNGAAASGYLRPTPVNAPIARVAPTRSDLSPTTAFSSFKPPPAGVTAAAHQSRIGGGNSSVSAARAKSFNKSPTPPTTNTTKTLPTTTITGATGAAPTQKPKPLTSKPSSAGAAVRSNSNVAGSRLGRAPQTTTTNSKFSSSRSPASRPVPAVKSTNIASLQQRFEGSGGSTTTSTARK